MSASARCASIGCQWALALWLLVPAQPPFPLLHAQQPPLVGFLTPPPPGLLPAAPKPQALGKYLYVHDITHALKGRHAELFWPDDGMWYLIEIQVCCPALESTWVLAPASLMACAV